MALIWAFSHYNLKYPQLHVHTEGLESLYRFVPKEMLPRHLGGDGPTPEAMHGNCASVA